MQEMVACSATTFQLFKIIDRRGAQRPLPADGALTFTRCLANAALTACHISANSSSHSGDVPHQWPPLKSIVMQPLKKYWSEYALLLLIYSIHVLFASLTPK